MINKIKDFLKSKLRRKASSEHYDQDELLDDDGFSEEQTNPTITVPAQLQEEDRTGEFQVAPPAQTSAPDEDPEEPAEEEVVAEAYESRAPKIGLKEKLVASLALMKGKLPRPKLKAFKMPQVPNKKDGGPLLSPSLSRSIEKVLSRSSREPIHQFFLVMLIASTTYTIGKITALGLKGAPVMGSPKDYAVNIPLGEGFNAASLAQVKRTNPFKTNVGQGKKATVADAKCEQAQQASNLPIKLINTVVLQDTVKSLASVQVRGDRDLQEVRIGDQISNMAKISKITRLEILVKNLESGMCESITSDKAQAQKRSPISVLSPSQSAEFKKNKPLPGIENVGNKFMIQKSLLDEKLKDIGAVLTQARAIKIQNPDGSLSFKMTELDPEGIFGYLGIQDQDIITSINGKPIYDMNEVMLLFGRIKGLDKLSLGIKREGTESTQEYSIKK